MFRHRVPHWTLLPAALRPLPDFAQQPSLHTQRRHLKTLDVREYRPLGTPIEFRFYQRYTNHPNRQSGIQFLSHYNTHQRFRVNKDYIDYMNWGREQGQARLPHRHQRVAFDFDDALHPTVGDSDSKAWFRSQDPTLGAHPDMASSFDPQKKVFSHPEHWNKFFSKRRPGEGDIKTNVLESPSLLRPLMKQTDTQDTAYFGVETRGPVDGEVPGVNAPFLGEFDRKVMQAMSRPLNRSHTLTTNNGRFSKNLYINVPDRHQALSATLAKELSTEIDKATNAVYSKLTVLEAAQSGRTDYFCGGVDREELGFNMHMAAAHRAQAAAQGVSEAEAQEHLRDAARYEDRADDLLRQNASLVWRAYTAPRPLMALVNGKCRGTGCGLALATKYCALRDSSEFIFDGPEAGLTPFGGLTRWLARPETSLKYPGLAEFIVLTGSSLFAGDALRLGWTDLFTTLPDMGYHIREWFDASEHMHNDAVAWQLGHLLESCFKMKDAHSGALERCAITPTRARWIEDLFADQPSVPAIMDTLAQVERLPLTDAHNEEDRSAGATPYTLASVAEALEKLERGRLRYTLSPWDVTPPEEEVAVRQAGELFTAYVLERRGGMDIAVSPNREKLRRWQRQREREYEAYTALRSAPHPRHVYARLEGCENTLVDFDFVFDPVKDAEGAADAAAAETATLRRLHAAVLSALGMPAGRDIEVGWYLPTLDTCPLRTDAEVMAALHADPGIEDPAAPTAHPPIYLTVKRRTLRLSEWAYAVRHQLLLQSPWALTASLALLREVRGVGDTSRPLRDALAIEHRYLSRAVRRPDFYAVGAHVSKSAEEWEEIRAARARDLHRSPRRPLPDFEAVFERDVELDGHRFALRPRWEPRTLAEVPEGAAEALAAPLSFAREGLVALDVAVQCAKEDRLAGMLDDIGGLEVVPRLGEVDAEGRPRVAPLEGNAHVPTNVNFYEMARHPFDDTPSSWRRDGYTEGSQAYFEEQYRAAEAAVYDPEGRGTRGYWPPRAAVEGTAEPESRAVLQERLAAELARAGRGVEPWARQLRERATGDQLDYGMEIATQREKIFDDEYYRWFIQPGQHPNPSGLLTGGRGAGKKDDADRELEALLGDLAKGGLAPLPEAEEVLEGLDPADVAPESPDDISPPEEA